MLGILGYKAAIHSSLKAFLCIRYWQVWQVEAYCHRKFRIQHYWHFFITRHCHQSLLFIRLFSLLLTNKFPEEIRINYCLYCGEKKEKKKKKRNRILWTYPSILTKAWENSSEHDLSSPISTASPSCTLRLLRFMRGDKWSHSLTSCASDSLWLTSTAFRGTFSQSRGVKCSVCTSLMLGC